MTADIRVQSASARLHVEVGAPPSDCWWVGFAVQPELDLEVVVHRGHTPDAQDIGETTKVWVSVSLCEPLHSAWDEAAEEGQGIDDWKEGKGVLRSRSLLCLEQAIS